MRTAFYPARRGSVPVASWQRQRLGQTDRAAIMEAARRLERATRRRGSGQHGGDLKQTGLQVLWQLLYRGFGRVGACDPSLQQVADETGLARSTVQTALGRLESYGILTRVRRALVVGRRWSQVTSAYLFKAPAVWRQPCDTGNRQALVSEYKTKAYEVELPLGPAEIGEAERVALVAKWGLSPRTEGDLA